MKNKIIAAFFTILMAMAILPSAASAACMAGDNLDVLWKGKWYGARVLKAGNGQCYITYNGYDNSWDEWVGADRYRFKLGAGSSANVLWKGQWYPARVLKTQGTQYYITYNGYDSSWDEWVGNDRIHP